MKPISSNGRLVIFDRFVTDTNLPKHKSKNSQFSIGAINTVIQGVSGMAIDEANFFSAGGLEEDPDSLAFQIQVSSANALRFSRNDGFFIRLFKKAYNSIIYKISEKRKMGVREFFSGMKNSVETIDNFKRLEERVTGYKQLMSQAMKNGQEALVDKIKRNITIIGLESRLYTLGYTKYITEESAVNFIKNTQRGISIDWIKHFTRFIPEDIIEHKIKCDNSEIFDNYVIMHYDPNNKNSELTEKEKEKKKDPILFGVINGSTKLYYLGDWIDDMCDLTLDKIADHFSTKGGGEIKEITSTIELA